ncbi:DNA/RNA helicase [Pontibacillus yanchengensis]|uniref:DNA/RNA helicase n=1 Tax=Pontibacillus yanchengensis TaxID=462910 RepID=A0A6I4ZUQ4_9BACI|nr:DEAD/DEAH box helicase [Pontibacillus yanchengensis]MYL33965.1 DNA/RNA helicase [Pontibacillus yanchengensis]
MKSTLFTSSFNWVPSQQSSFSTDLSSKLAGRLWLETNLPLSQKEQADLIQKGLLTHVPALESNWWGRRCRRCGNTTERLIVPWPCGCGQKCHYCRSCIEMGRIASCTSFLLWTGAEPDWHQHVDACAWTGKLTPFQQQGANRIVDTVENNGRLLVWAVCGAGKTEMLFPGLERALGLGRRICLATPRADVVRELKPRLQQAFPHVDIVALYGGSDDVDNGAQFIIATTHQLLKYARAFDVMIIDEVDAFPYHSDPKLHFAAARSLKKTASLIYLTATPRFPLKVSSYLKKLPTVFVPERYHGHPLPVPRFLAAFDTKASFPRKQLPKAFNDWLQQKKNEKRRVIVFVPTIELAETMTNMVEGAVYVHSEDVERKEKVQRFRDKEISLLITTTILERGVTFPSIDVAVIDAGHQVFDEAALVQIAGRAGRSADDPNGDVVFFHNGKSSAMVRAREAIQGMNRRAGKER